MEEIWKKIERKIGDKVPLCVKMCLEFCAYDSLNVLKELNELKIVEIEEYITDCGQDMVNDLYCCHSEKYKKQTKFKFLPGHRSILKILPEKISGIFENHNELRNLFLNTPVNSEANKEFSVILNELIKSSQINAHKSKNHAEYSDTIRYFFTYVYLLSGKSAYETLQKNLPIPSTKTICRCLYWK